MAFERYHEAVDYLQRRLWHELPIVPVERALQSRIRTLLSHFGDPHLSMPVIHVGGSAGKGSTSAMAAAILRAAGLRTGLYTSPHLQTFIERIDVDGRLIAPDTFADLVIGVDPLVRKMHIDVLDGVGYGRPALVEVAFAVAMKHFADEGCDAAVVEVGLGGRTDCTNVFEQKAVTVITNIELEHTERLGRTRSEIAREKSMLVRGGEVVVTGETHRDALDVIARRCAETGTAMWRLGREIRVRASEANGCGSTFDVQTPLGEFKNIRVTLDGAHQVTNAALATAASLVFADRIGVALVESALRAGLGSVRANGRLEQVQAHPTVLLDGAHNPVEARRLAEALRLHVFADGGSAPQPGARQRRAPTSGETRKLRLVCGILADKDQASMVRALAPIAASVVVTQPPIVERAGDPARMIALFRRELGGANVRFEPNPERALDLALGDAAADDVVCVTGSMYLVGALRERWVPEQRILERRTAALS